MRNLEQQDWPPLVEVLPAELAVLALLDRPELLRDLAARVDWATLLPLASHHRLSGSLAAAIERCGEPSPVPPAVHDEVVLQRARVEVRSSSEILPQLEEVCDALVSVGVAPTLLKGAALVWSGMVPGGERPMADLDLLVAGRDVVAASQALERLGYRSTGSARTRRWARAHHYQDPAWRHPDRPLDVEVHWALQEHDHRLGFESSTLVTVPLGLPSGTTVKRLGDRDLLTHLCLHFWRDRADGGPASLGQLWDIRRVSPSADAPLWTELRSIALIRGHVQVLAAVLACSHVVLGGPLPPGYPEVRRMAASEELRSFAIRRVLAPRPRHIQLLMVTADVDHTAWRVVSRIAAQTRRRTAELRDIYGAGSAWRLRLRHVAATLALLGLALRSPLEAAAELRLDRWAHRLR
jgi:hypothetical protein